MIELSPTTRPTLFELDPTTRPTLSVDEFAVVTGIARSTAFAAVKAGDVPSMRLGRRIRIPTAAVRRMLELDTQAASVVSDAGCLSATSSPNKTTTR